LNDINVLLSQYVSHTAAAGPHGERTSNLSQKFNIDVKRKNDFIFVLLRSIKFLLIYFEEEFFVVVFW
jgi:hypothetical protein